MFKLDLRGVAVKMLRIMIIVACGLTACTVSEVPRPEGNASQFTRLWRGTVRGQRYFRMYEFRGRFELLHAVWFSTER